MIEIKMNILQINSFFSTGGPPRIVKGIYDTLYENGHSCILASSREKPIQGMNIIKIGTTISYYLHALNSRLFDSDGLSSKTATKKLIKEIDSLQPEILHLHNLHGYYLNYEILFEFIKKTDIPVVWTLHDCWAFTGHCAYFDYIGCEKWKTTCNKCPQIKSYPQSLFLDNSKKNFYKKKNAFNGVNNLTLVTPSLWLSNLVSQSFLKKYPIRVIYNGINLNLFKPTISHFREENGLKDKFIVLGVTQIWGERKGLNYFIELSKILNDGYKIVIVGLSEKQKKSLPENILGIVRTDSIQELATIYTAADVFVNPTLEDNFPTTNIEAIACGTPVITFNTGGSVESIDETCGMKVGKGNLIELQNAIKKLKDEKNLTTENCLNRALLFRREDRFNEYIRLYESICKSET
jgi:glycosyltransferase involved in cell wall biosynthesis